jgi:hypothetical protein
MSKLLQTGHSKKNMKWGDNFKINFKGRGVYMNRNDLADDPVLGIWVRNSEVLGFSIRDLVTDTVNYLLFSRPNWFSNEIPFPI